MLDAIADQIRERARRQVAPDLHGSVQLPCFCVELQCQPVAPRGRLAALDGARYQRRHRRRALLHAHSSAQHLAQQIDIVDDMRKAVARHDAILERLARLVIS
jgi:hypothetical protein